MPMPPAVQMRLIKRSLVGKEGLERVRILQAHLEKLPGYMSGPYGDIRAWINTEIERSRVRAKVKHQETFAVAKEGHRQVVLTGPPNAGKSALLQALSGRQVKVADYPFATLKPTAGLVWLDGAAIQFVEVPGIVAGAALDKGGGRALLGAVRNADYLVLVASLGDPLEALGEVLYELEAAGIAKPAVLCLTGLDLPGAPERVGEFTERYRDAAAKVAATSAQTGAGLDDLRAAVWSLAGLIRVWPAAGQPGDKATPPAEQPFVLDRGGTVADLAYLIHKQLAARLKGARVWGPSAKFDAQQVGPRHELADGDQVELILER